MLYRVRATGAVKTQGEVRKLHPNTSLPAVWNTDTLEFLGVDPVFNAPQPTPTELQRVAQQGVVQDSKGNWMENWVLVDMFSTYTKEDGTVVTKEEQEQAHLTKLTEAKAQTVRTQRDKLLAETDWMVIKAAETGVTLASDWALYRQELRDITAQTGFPDTVEYPAKPQ